MDETAINYPTLYEILNWFMLLGGLAVAVYVVWCHRRNPPNRKKCKEAIVTRSWDTIQMGVLLCSLMLLYIVAAFVKQFIHEEQFRLFELLAIIAIYSVHITIITLMNRFRGVGWSVGFGMGFNQLKMLALSPMLYLAMIPFLMLATQGYQWIFENWLGQEVTLQDTARTITEERSWLELGYILAAIFAAPIYEEILFRGLLFPYFAKRIGLIGSACVVSVLFALIHAHLPSLLPLFMLSAALCLAYWRTGSLWTCIGIHAIYNAIGTLALKLAG